MVIDNDAPILTQKTEGRYPILEIPDPATVCKKRFGAASERERENTVAVDIEKHSVTYFLVRALNWRKLAVICNYAKDYQNRAANRRPKFLLGAASVTLCFDQHCMRNQSKIHGSAQ
ncbi:MAG TPA: hypothetical protein VLA51_00585 [Paracoccaceae bacterium]|nr:hypothetical protein [Paracoccaceae bacterium]